MRLSYLRTRRASSLVMTASVMPRPHLVGEQPGERGVWVRGQPITACGRPSPGTMGFVGCGPQREESLLLLSPMRGEGWRRAAQRL